MNLTAPWGAIALLVGGLAFIVPSSDAAGCPFSGGGGHGGGTITAGRRTTRNLQGATVGGFPTVTSTVPFTGQAGTFCPDACVNTRIGAIPGSALFCDLIIGAAEIAAAPGGTIAAGDTSCGACLQYQSCLSLVEVIVPSVGPIVQPLCPGTCAVDITSPASAQNHCSVTVAQGQQSTITPLPLVHQAFVPNQASASYCWECMQFDSCLILAPFPLTPEQEPQPEFCFDAPSYPLSEIDPAQFDWDALANDYGILFEFARTTIFPGDPAPFSLLNPGVVNGRLPGMFKRMGFHDSAAIKDYHEFAEGSADRDYYSRNFFELVDEAVNDPLGFDSTGRFKNLNYRPADVPGEAPHVLEYMWSSGLDASVLVCPEERVHPNQNYDLTATRIAAILASKILSPDCGGGQADPTNGGVSIMEKYRMSYADALFNGAMAALNYLSKGQFVTSNASIMSFGRRDACYFGGGATAIPLCGRSDQLPSTLYHATQFYQWFENRGMDVTCGLSLMGTHGLMDGNGGTTDPDPTVDIASLPFTWTNRYFKMLTQGTHRLMDDATKLPPLGVVLPEPVPGQPVTSYFTADTILPIVGAQRQLEDGDDHEHHRKLVTNGAEGIVGVKWIDKDYNALGQSLFPFSHNDAAMASENLLREYYTQYAFENPQFAAFSETFLQEMQDTLVLFAGDLPAMTDTYVCSMLTLSGQKCPSLTTESAAVAGTASKIVPNACAGPTNFGSYAPVSDCTADANTLPTCSGTTAAAPAAGTACPGPLRKSSGTTGLGISTCHPDPQSGQCFAGPIAEEHPTNFHTYWGQLPPYDVQSDQVVLHGCFVESADPNLLALSFSASATVTAPATASACASACLLQLGYEVAGLQNGGNCHCGYRHNFARHGAVPLAECDSGGGVLRNRVYGWNELDVPGMNVAYGVYTAASTFTAETGGVVAGVELGPGQSATYAIDFGSATAGGAPNDFAVMIVGLGAGEVEVSVTGSGTPLIGQFSSLELTASSVGSAPFPAGPQSVTVKVLSGNAYVRDLQFTALGNEGLVPPADATPAVVPTGPVFNTCAIFRLWTNNMATSTEILGGINIPAPGANHAIDVIFAPGSEGTGNTITLSVGDGTAANFVPILSTTVDAPPFCLNGGACSSLDGSGVPLVAGAYQIAVASNLCTTSVTFIVTGGAPPPPVPASGILLYFYGNDLAYSSPSKVLVPNTGGSYAAQTFSFVAEIPGVDPTAVDRWRFLVNGAAVRIRDRVFPYSMGGDDGVTLFDASNTPGIIGTNVVIDVTFRLLNGQRLQDTFTVNMALGVRRGLRGAEASASGDVYEE